MNHELVQLIGGEGASNCEPGFDNYDKCMYDTLSNITMAELDCTVPWLPGDRCEVHTEHNELAISFLYFSSRHWPHVCKNDKDRKAAFKIYQENRRNQMDVCPNTCQNTNVYFGPLVTGDREEIDKVLIMTCICPTPWSLTCLNNHCCRMLDGWHSTSGRMSNPAVNST